MKSEITFEVILGWIIGGYLVIVISMLCVAWLLHLFKELFL